MKATKWGDVPSGQSNKKYVDAAGTYVFIIEKAWDSLFAPAGETMQRHIGLMAKVVGPKNSLQVGRLIRVRLFIGSEAAQSVTKGALERMNISIDPETSPEDGLSVEELIGVYFQGIVEETDTLTKDGTPFVEIKGWNITEAHGEFNNNPREITVDNKGEISKRYYSEEATKRESRIKTSAVSDEEIPF
ncbi:MAG: hypothetical protein WCY30_01695 [Candidatus Neomarinimicrobiota bacterium]|jgi:hypothetical protein